MEGNRANLTIGLVERMAARARSEASVSRIIGDSGSQCPSISAVVNASLILLNATWQSVVQDQSSFFWVRRVSGEVISA